MDNSNSTDKNSGNYDKMISLLQMDVCDNKKYSMRYINECRDDIIELLKININKVDSNGTSALIFASMFNYANLVEYLISLNDLDITLCDNNDHDALYFSIIRHNLKTFDLLLKTKKFNLNKIFAIHHNTYLICAVIYNNYDAIDILIENGANVNILNIDDVNAFMIACRDKNSYTSELVKHINDINYKSKKYNLNAFEFLFNFHDIVESSDDESYSKNCEIHCDGIRYNGSTYENIIDIACDIIRKRNDIVISVERHEVIYLEIIKIIFECSIKNDGKYIILFKKLVECGMDIDDCLKFDGSRYVFEHLHSFIFNFKISNKKIALHMIQFDNIYFDVLTRIEYNKSFVNSKLLNKQINKINYLPDSYKTLFFELSFSRKLGVNIDDILNEDRFYKLKLLFDIYNISDLDRFLNKHQDIFNI